MNISRDFMTKCTKCQTEYLFVMDKGEKNRCPKCYPYSNTQVFLMLVGFFVILVVGFMVTNNSKAQNKQPLTHEQMVNRQFSGWDGSHNGLVKVVKANLKDPSSFEHVKTQYADKYNFLVVTMQYRGKNSFGAIVTEEVVAKTDMDGNVLDIIK